MENLFDYAMVLQDTEHFKRGMVVRVLHLIEGGPYAEAIALRDNESHKIHTKHMIVQGWQNAGQLEYKTAFDVINGSV